MLNTEQMIILASNIKIAYPNESKDFVDAFEWLSLAIDGILTKVGSNLENIHKSGEYDKLTELIDLSRQLKIVQLGVDDYSQYFESQDSEEIEMAEEACIEAETEEIEKKNSPDYKNYAINEEDRKSVV